MFYFDLNADLYFYTFTGQIQILETTENAAEQMVACR